MDEVLSDPVVDELVTTARVLEFVKAGVLLVVGLILARMLAAAVGRLVGRRAGAQEAMVARRLVFYGLGGLVLASAMHQVGFQLTVLLGAAGILTVALGFASQTSASNVISGLFLIFERPFVVGDLVKIGDLTGEVLSIDLLSIKLRTFDNLFVRVPNEEIIKSTVTTLTRFPIRRLDVLVGVAYKEDVARVRRVLLDVADRHPLCLDEPKPLVLFKGFGESSIDLQFSVWAQREKFLELRNSIQEQVKATFDELGIEIPFPHRTLYAGSATDPIPVRMVADAADAADAADGGDGPTAPGSAG